MRAMFNRLETKVKETLIELLMGIMIYGVAAQVVILFIPSFHGIKENLGLWFGILLALGLSLHMTFMMVRALDMPESGIRRFVISQSLIRYGVVLILFAVVGFTRILNPVTAFVGVIGLKIGVYLCGITHGIYKKITENYHRRT